MKKTMTEMFPCPRCTREDEVLDPQCPTCSGTGEALTFHYVDPEVEALQQRDVESVITWRAINSDLYTRIANTHERQAEAAERQAAAWERIATLLEKQDKTP